MEGGYKSLLMYLCKETFLLYCLLLYLLYIGEYVTINAYQ